MPNALASMHRSGGFGVSRKTVESWMQRLSMGSTFEEAITASSHEVPALDIALLGSGEKSGRLEDCLSALSHYYSQIAANIRSVLSGLAWPILTLFVMMALGPLPDLVLKGDVYRYFEQVFRPLVILCGLFVLMSLAFDSRRGRPWQAWMERVLGLVPFLGGGIKAMALARFSLALEALLNAGVDTPKAWSSAAYASGSPMLAREMKSFGPSYGKGSHTFRVVAGSSLFPRPVQNVLCHWRAVRKSGREPSAFDSSLRRGRLHEVTSLFSLVSPLDLFDHCVGRRLSDSFLLLRIFWWSWHLRQYE